MSESAWYPLCPPKPNGVGVLPLPVIRLPKASVTRVSVVLSLELVSAVVLPTSKTSGPQ